MPNSTTRERGELERDILLMLRERTEPASVRELRDAFTGHVPAYTTLMTVLTRLEKKGEVVRSGDSPRKTKFRSARTEEQAASESMLSALGQASDRQAALLEFAGSLDASDVALLNQAFGGGNGGRDRARGTAGSGRRNDPSAGTGSSSDGSNSARPSPASDPHMDR